jgi:hypothetical protein
MQDNAARPDCAPHPLVGYAIQATVFAPLVGMGALEWLRWFGFAVSGSIGTAAISIAITWLAWFGLGFLSRPARRGPGAFGVLNDPATGAGAKFRSLATNVWGIAMLLFFAAGVANLVLTYA